MGNRQYPKNSKYLTLEETIRQNGDRHLERAIAYISAGYPDRFADGSLKKAIRNYEKAKVLKLFDEDMSFVMKDLIKNFSKRIADNILNGKG